MTRGRDTYDRFSTPERGLFGESELAPQMRGRVTGASNLLDLALVLHHQTEKAILVSITGEESLAVWLPKRRVEIEPLAATVTGHRRSGQAVKLSCVTVTMPQALAVEKRLV